MVTDTRWLIVLCVVAQILLANCRVLDNEHQEIFKREGEEDPYEEGFFEEDRYEEPMMSDQPVIPSQRRPYRSCTSSEECYPDECCHIGMQRYSEPYCMSLGNENDYCRMDQEPVNTTLGYPNGMTKKMTNSYILFCPCMEGLTCLRAICRPYKELYLMDGADVNNL